MRPVLGFEIESSTSAAWGDLIRDLVATAATPLDLSVDRLGDLLVLSSLVVSDALETPGDDGYTVAVRVEEGRIIVDVTAHGDHDPSRHPVSEMALSVLADEHWAETSTRGSQVGFAFNI